jgi:hypothetical protein
MQTLTQLIGLVTVPGKNTVEFKLIFTKEDYDKARDILLEKGYPLWDSLSADTPVADRLEDLYMMMKALEMADGAKEHEWKPGFFKQWYPSEKEKELDRLYQCVAYDRLDDVDRKDLWKREVGIVIDKLYGDRKIKHKLDELSLMPTHPEADVMAYVTRRRAELISIKEKHVG